MTLFIKVWQHDFEDYILVTVGRGYKEYRTLEQDELSSFHLQDWELHQDVNVLGH